MVGAFDDVQVLVRAGDAGDQAHLMQNARADATTAGPIQGLQASLQRRQSVRLRMNVLHMFLYAP